MFDLNFSICKMGKKHLKGNKCDDKKNSFVVQKIKFRNEWRCESLCLHSTGCYLFIPYFSAPLEMLATKKI